MIFKSVRREFTEECFGEQYLQGCEGNRVVQESVKLKDHNRGDDTGEAIKLA